MSGGIVGKPSNNLLFISFRDYDTRRGAVVVAITLVMAVVLGVAVV